MAANQTDLVLRLTARTERLERDLNKAQNKLSSFERKTNNISQNIANNFAAAFAIGSVVSFGQEIIKTTAEFEKLKAVLTNTLGSSSEAEQSFNKINEFASKTPFSVLELTDAFVKLTNFGLKPSERALTAYGDLAASTGKSFDQLAEAIIDATTGEFERLKEFGVRASKQGDKVEFTFKGVKTQVDFTGESIRDYIESLGKAQGVSGGMAAISETLAGKLSNIDDAVTTLKASIGSLVAGPLSDFLTKASEIVNELSFFTENASAGSWLIAALGSFNIEVIKGINNITRLKKELEELQNQSPTGPAQLFTPQSLGIVMPDESNSTSPARQKIDLAPMLSGIDEIPEIGENLADKLSVIPDVLSEFRVRTLEEMGAVTQTLQASFFELQSVVLKSGQQIQAVFIDMGDLINGGINAIISGFSVGRLNGAFQSLKMFLGDAMQQLGQALVSINTGKIALTKVPPPAGIAIGLGLIAAGAALSNSASKKLSALSGSGGLSGGGGTSSFRGIGNIQLEGQVSIRGADLVYVLNRQNAINGRTG